LRLAGGQNGASAKRQGASDRETSCCQRLLQYRCVLIGDGDNEWKQIGVHLFPSEESR